MIRVASAFVAAFAIIPMQGVRGLDSSHRMNQPSQAEGSWEWRFAWDQVASWHAERPAELGKLHERIPKKGEARQTTV
jgi:4-alpha-glucanotransferase